MEVLDNEMEAPLLFLQALSYFAVVACRVHRTGTAGWPVAIEIHYVSSTQTLGDSIESISRRQAFAQARLVHSGSFNSGMECCAGTDRSVGDGRCPRGQALEPNDAPGKDDSDPRHA